MNHTSITKKVLICNIYILIFCLLTAVLPQPASAANAYDMWDVRFNWARPAINYVLSKGYMNGVGGNRFAPSGTVTRAQMAQVIYNRVGSPEVDLSQNVFSDVNTAKWYGRAIVWCRENGIVNGIKANAFAPDAPVTREQLAQFLCNFDKNVLGMDIASDEETAPYNINTIRLTGKGKTKIIAHRGGGGIATENTLEAFTRSGVLSYYALECDVRRTKDGEYVIFHDRDMERMAGMPGGIGDYTLEKLKKVRLYETRLDKRVGEKSDKLTIPTLREYLRICKKYNKRAVIEINSPLSTSDVYKIIDIVKSEKYLDKTIFISFELNLLISIRNQLPNQALMLNFYSSMKPVNYISRLRQYRIGCNCGEWEITRELVQTLHGNKIEVGCWTVNDELKAERLLSYGVDYITTDILE